ncbi:hypothetical protein [Agromyces soli]|uniref:DUF2746 domain-containing protein n=1 Tax=Agromyces soli TaxID=659012 RepID=A0ABY4AWI8_9MICO|nr:hypothetical protein [Agromyces soli]UOE27194.1 hypothetical protein MTP13_05260 [Agromyces soli]
MTEQLSPDWLTVVADWLADIDLLHLAFVVAAAVLALRLLVRLWPWLRRVVALVEALGTLPGFMERTDASVRRLRRQLEDDHERLHDELHEELHDELRDELGPDAGRAPGAEHRPPTQRRPRRRTPWSRP